MNYLISFYYLRKDISLMPIFEQMIENGDTILLDSGAFSNFMAQKSLVNMADYISFLKDFKDKVWRYIQLDVINNGQLTLGNLDYMRDEGFDPVPVLHLGMNAGEISQINSQNSFIAVGGPPRSHRSVKMRYYQQLSKENQVDFKRCHFLGQGSPFVLYKFLPYSFDTTTWILSARFGHARIWDESAMRFNYVQTENKNDKVKGCNNYQVSCIYEYMRYEKTFKLFGSRMFWPICNRKDYGLIQEAKVMKEENAWERDFVLHRQLSLFPMEEFIR